MKLRCEQGGEEDREMTGKDRMCSVRDLEPATEYAVKVLCWRAGKWEVEREGCDEDTWTPSTF